MKRFIISLSFIFLFVISVIAFDQWYMDRFENRINQGLDAVLSAKDERGLQESIKMLNEDFYHSRSVVSQFVFANRLEEMETALYKLNAYVEIQDHDEIMATAEEVRARLHLLE